MANDVITLLCNQYGEAAIFNLFIERWGVETVYNILSEIIVGEGLDADITGGEDISDTVS